MDCEWLKKPEKECGIICGCDQSQEWLLPWWWERYRLSNSFPVSFADFGMSETAKRWCREKGELFNVELEATHIKMKHEIDPEAAHYWEQLYGPEVWKARQNWFKKPFALLNSPYRHSIWIDLDCEVLNNVKDLFLACDQHSQLAMVREHKTNHLPRFHAEARYNGGVIVAIHGAAIIEKWAEESLKRNHQFWGDDPLLSALIKERRLEIVELPQIYNWRLANGINMGAVIHHWTGTGGKAYIKQYGGIQPAIHSFNNKKY